LVVSGDVSVVGGVGEGGVGSGHGATSMVRALLSLVAHHNLLSTPQVILNLIALPPRKEVSFFNEFQKRAFVVGGEVDGVYLVLLQLGSLLILRLLPHHSLLRLLPTRLGGLARDLSRINDVIEMSGRHRNYIFF